MFTTTKKLTIVILIPLQKYALFSSFTFFSDHTSDHFQFCTVWKLYSIHSKTALKLCPTEPKALKNTVITSHPSFGTKRSQVQILSPRPRFYRYFHNILEWRFYYYLIKYALTTFLTIVRIFLCFCLLKPSFTPPQNILFFTSVADKIFYLPKNFQKAFLCLMQPKF